MTDREITRSMSPTVIRRRADAVKTRRRFVKKVSRLVNKFANSHREVAKVV